MGAPLLARVVSTLYVPATIGLVAAAVEQLSEPPTSGADGSVVLGTETETGFAGILGAGWDPEICALEIEVRAALVSTAMKREVLIPHYS
jgi:hypothetical protein